MSYRVTWEPPNGFYVHFTGWVTPESAARLARELTSDVRYDDLRYAIVDLTDSPGHTFRRNSPGRRWHGNGRDDRRPVFEPARVRNRHRVRVAHVELPRYVRDVLNPAVPGFRDPAGGPRMAISTDDLAPSPAIRRIKPKGFSLDHEVPHHSVGHRRHGQELPARVIDHPAMELVARYVYSPTRRARTPGPLPGAPATGVFATHDVDEILALDADVVIHAARLAPPYGSHDADILQLAGRGQELISMNGYSRPESLARAAYCGTGGRLREGRQSD